MKKLFIVLGIIVLLVPVFYSHSSYDVQQKADIVIFSYDRPLQLYALLESLQTYCQGIGETHVIYRVSSDQFDLGYQIVAHDFSHVRYHKQGRNPQQDFKPLTLDATFESSSDYILFAVDDIVVKDQINITECIDALEKYNAYGFYLRLGKNLNQCYSLGSKAQPVPPLTQEELTIFSWCFNEGIFDWQYPHTVDMALYRKKDIASDLRLLSYHAPNKLEDMWHRQSRAIISKKGLCYQTSKIVNMPLNRVQDEYKNLAMKEWTAQGLLHEFLAGKKMAIAPLYGVHNIAAHMEYSPTFINR